MKPVRVLHVVPGLEPSQGGPAYTVPRLCDALAVAGMGVWLFSTARQFEAEKVMQCTPADIRCFKWDYSTLPFIGGLRKSAALSNRLKSSGGEFDIVHVHGLWNMASIIALRFGERTHTRLVLAPRGMLSPGALRISRFKKWLFWRLLQRRSLKHLACFHATSELEAQEIRAFQKRWNLNMPVAVVPNGVDMPKLLPRLPSPGQRTILYLGRIHPKKGLDVLIRAWARIAQENPGWRLQIVGPDERGYAKELGHLVEHLGVSRVLIEGPRYGAEKTAIYRNADIFVLPSHSENFGVTVVEALSLEVPVVATKSTPWQSLEEHGCGWWIDEGIAPLATSLKAAMALSPEKRVQMGAAGRTFVGAAFRWESIGLDMAHVYEWLLERGPMPEFVR